MTPSVRSRRTSTSRRSLVVVGLAVFVLVDIVLVGLALHGRSSANAEVLPSVTPLPTQTVTTATPTATPTASSAPITASTTAVPPTRFLSAVDGSEAWRAAAGTCPGPMPTLEHSTDRGSSWSSAPVRTRSRLSQVARIQPTGTSSLFLVGLAGADCSPAFITTSDSGRTFSTDASQLSEAWYVSPADRSRVHSPSGEYAAPCSSVIGLAVAGDAGVAVLCDDHRVFRTTDGGADWDSGVTVPGAVSLDNENGSWVLAATGNVHCAGVRIEALSAVGDPTTRGCLVTTADAPGEVAVSAGGDSVWVWAGNTVRVSADGGRTW